MDSLFSSEFKASCPSCYSGHGTARAVTIRNYEKTITYVCDACENEWAMTDSVQLPTLGLFRGFQEGHLGSVLTAVPTS